MGSKLEERWAGPLKVLECMNDVNYRILVSVAHNVKAYEEHDSVEEWMWMRRQVV